MAILRGREWKLMWRRITTVGGGEARRLTAKNKDMIGPGGIRNAAGEVISGGEVSINVWKEYYIAPC